LLKKALIDPSNLAYSPAYSLFWTIQSPSL